jgi:hypothetical protein
MMTHHKEMNLLKTKHRADVEKETSDILNGNRNLASPEVNVNGMSNEVQELSKAHNQDKLSKAHNHAKNNTEAEKETSGIPKGSRNLESTEVNVTGVSTGTKC